MNQGLIIKNVTNTYFVKCNDIVYQCISRGKFKEETIKPTVGDIVEFEIINYENKEAVIEKVIDRKSYIRRPKVANVDTIILVISSKMPKPDLLMLDKQLAFAKNIGVEPIIVVNKIDLDINTAKIIKDEYTKIGYKVFLTNTLTFEGIQDILETIKHKHIIALAGNSGVGKSSLINSILKKEETIAGEISKKNKKGKNTTTITSLYEIKNEVYLVDTPGFSTFDIEEIDSKDLEKLFVEFKNYTKNCEFQGCSHIKEEVCGIKDAVNDGKISKNRYERYKKIYEDLKYKEEHKRW